MMKQLVICICLVLLSSCYQQADVSHSQVDGTWIRDSTTHYRLNAQKGVRTEKKLKVIAEKMDSTQRELLLLLNEERMQKLDVFFLKDRETLTSFTGFPANGYTDTEKGIIYFVDKEPFHLALRHEIMHALSWRLWGLPKGYWISEGIAVLASGNCGGYDLHALANAIHNEKKLVSFSKITDSFDFKSLEPSLQAASMVKYIYETYGIAVLKTFWKKGWEHSQNIIGIPAAEVEKRWIIHIELEKYKAKINWEEIKEHGCE